MALRSIGLGRFTGASGVASNEVGGLDGVLKKLCCRREVYLAPANGDDAIHAQFTDDFDTAAGITNPDVPRNVKVVFGANWTATNGGDVEVTGVCADGIERTETITVSAGATVTGTYPFVTITNLANTVACTPGAGVTCDVKTADANTTVFGVPAKAVNAFIALTANGAYEAIAAQSLTLGTFRPTTVPDGAKHFQVTYTVEELADRAANEP